MDVGRRFQHDCQKTAGGAPHGLEEEVGATGGSPAGFVGGVVREFAAGEPPPAEGTVADLDDV